MSEPFQHTLNQDVLLQVIKSHSSLAALPAELQLSIIEELAYFDLKNLARTSKAMRQLVATSTPILDAKLFRCKRATSREIKALRRASKLRRTDAVEPHPAMGKMAIDLRTTWSNLCLGDRISKENATHPAVSDLSFDVWTDDNAHFYLSALSSKAGLDDAGLDEWVACNDVGIGTEVVKIKNADGTPVTLGQVIEKFCHVASGLGQTFSAFGDLRHQLDQAVWVGCWDWQSFKADGGLSLRNVMWFWWR